MAETQVTSPTGGIRARTESLLAKHGDMLFDLSESLLRDEASARAAVRAISRDLERLAAREKFQTNERAWVLSVAVERLLKMVGRVLPVHEPADRIQLDAAQGIPTRMRRLDHYLRRLPHDQHLVLILRDKYGMPYGEVAAILGMAESAVKVRRQQALRALEDWIWGEW